MEPLGVIMGIGIGMLLMKWMQNNTVRQAIDELEKSVKYAEKMVGYANRAQETASKAQGHARTAQDLTLASHERERGLKKRLKLVTDREKYLLETVNEAMNVTEVKRFIRGRLERAPFEPVYYEDKRQDIGLFISEKED